MVARGLRSGERMSSKGHRGIFYGDGMFYVFTVVMVTGLHGFVKTCTLTKGAFYGA